MNELNKLKMMKIWIPYLVTPEGNTFRKKPSLDGKRYAGWSNRDILITYEDAIELQHKTPGLVGVGFIIPNEYTVVDLDNCYPDKIPEKLLFKYHSYTELSPSGSGIHIIVKSGMKKCTKWTEIINGQSVEYLTPGNFVTFTGNMIKGTDIKDVAILQPEKKFVRYAQDKPVGVSVDIKDSGSYGKAAIAGECANIKQSRVGSRTNTILRAAFKLGQLIPSGIVNEAQAIRELQWAGDTTGLTRTKILNTIASGIEAGKKQPRNIILNK